MGSNLIQSGLPLALLIIISGAINYALSLWLIRFGKKMIFLLPLILILAMIVFGILGFLSTDWSRLGYLLWAFIALGAFIGSLISALMIQKKLRN